MKVRSKKVMKAGQLGGECSKRALKTTGKCGRGPALDGDSKICM